MAEIINENTSLDNIETTDTDIFVVIEIEKTYYGINSNFVTEMVQVNEITHDVDAPDYVMGVAVLREKVFPIIDLRTLFGKESMEKAAEEFIKLLSVYEKAHVEWVNELETSVAEKREFKLARNPHKCKFGQWYDNYQTDDMIISNFLKKFEHPHREIHDIADKVLTFLEKGEAEEANYIIEHTKTTTLKHMITLFADMKALIKERVKTLVLLMNVHDNIFGINVDNIHSVQQIQESKRENLNDFLVESLAEHKITQSARIKLDGEEAVVMLLDAELIFEYMRK